MTGLGPVIWICAAILAVLAGRAFWVVRHEHKAPRGSLPGKGDHVIDASYTSGGGGGGQVGSFTVPRDPQDYARRFVPKTKPEE